MNAHSKEDFDLFNPYPHSAGHRGVDTSIAAAADVSMKLGNLQAQAQRAIAGAGPRGLTADELADVLGCDRYTIQPRTSELKLKGVIGDSKQRRFNASCKKAIVWVMREHVPAADAR